MSTVFTRELFIRRGEKEENRYFFFGLVMADMARVFTFRFRDSRYIDFSGFSLANFRFFMFGWENSVKIRGNFGTFGGLFFVVFFLVCFFLVSLFLLFFLFVCFFFVSFFLEKLVKIRGNFSPSWPFLCLLFLYVLYLPFLSWPFPYLPSLSFPIKFSEQIP